jgi:hypothetical protein
MVQTPAARLSIDAFFLVAMLIRVAVENAVTHAIFLVFFLEQRGLTLATDTITAPKCKIGKFEVRSIDSKPKKNYDHYMHLK